MTQQEFLLPDVQQIRHQIPGILDSYSHDWDILSELLQNSVDAIREKQNGKGHISVVVDAPNKTITITDNGIGIKKGDIKTLMRPFGTDKINKPKQIGEKGVGLNFVMFSSSRMIVKSKRGGEAFTVEVKEAASWLQSESQSPLYLTLTEGENISNETSVAVTLPSDDHPVFEYSFEELIFVLLTRTACGDTGYIWNDAFNADTKLTFINKNGDNSEREFECRYMLPTEGAKSSESISIDDFQTWLSERDRSDAEKRRRLLNKIVFTAGKQLRAGRDIRYWSCFVPRREYWKTLSKNVGLPISEDTDLSLDETFGTEFTGGLSTSTKGMPTGIRIELKPRGSAGYVPNFFMIIDDPSLRFDIGRKAVQGRQQGMLRDIAYENFREYLNKTRKYMGGAVDDDNIGWDRDELFEEINSLPDMGSAKTRFSKRPNSQEATVAAIFYELLGKGNFANLSPLITGYKSKYDLYAKWKNRRVVIEFKFDLQGLLNDFNDERKMFDEINAVVLWEVTEQDHILAARRAMNVDTIQETSLVAQNKFPGANKTLNLGDVNPINIIELKPILGLA